jgi:hypothetical protein
MTSSVNSLRGDVDSADSIAKTRLQKKQPLPHHFTIRETNTQDRRSHAYYIRRTHKNINSHPKAPCSEAGAAPQGSQIFTPFDHWFLHIRLSVRTRI